MLTAMTLALSRRTNIPRSTKKDPKDTPDRVFKNIDCSITFGTEGVLRSSDSPEYSIKFIVQSTGVLVQ